MNGEFLPTGKLDHQILKEMIRRYTRADDRVLLGPQVGEDTAALDMGDRVLIVTMDPITFATDEIGYYSVVVNANDIATTGAQPQWFTVSILLPEGKGNNELVESIFDQLYKACLQFGISLIGGHTEITHGLDRPILVGNMMGEVQKGDMITTGGAKPGDVILLSKGICIEGTSIIAREKERVLLSRGLSEDLLKRAKRFLYDPGISILGEARLACQAGRVHAMHDVTEGGLANGLHELAMAGGLEIEVEPDRIPIYEESRILCEALALNPLGVIASGSLLITASPAEAEKILKKTEGTPVTITRIGRVKTFGAPSVRMNKDGKLEPVPLFERDELAKLF